MEREQREKWDEREKEEKVEEEKEVEEDQRVRVTQCGTNKNRILLSLTDAHCKITHAVSQQFHNSIQLQRLGKPLDTKTEHKSL